MNRHTEIGCKWCVCTYRGIPIIRSNNLMAENICQCGHYPHDSNGLCKYFSLHTCQCTVYTPITPAKTDKLIQYTADQLDIPYRVSKAGREYCVYYIGSGKGLIELVIMTNIKNIQFIPVVTNGIALPWYVTWVTPTTTHKETLAKFTDILLLIQLLQEGVNAKKSGKAEAYK